MMGLVPAEEVGPLLRKIEDEARVLLEEKGIRPRYEINGRPFYDGAAFGEVTTLLRAARAIEEPGQLLRPASNLESDSATLVRPVCPPITESASTSSNDSSRSESAEDVRITNHLT